MSFAHTLRAEWIKLRSVRSTWLTIACLLVVGLGITALATSSNGQDYATLSPADRAAWDPTGLSLRSYIVAQLVIGVLGILVVTGEFATGLIQASLTATPRRHRLLAAKVALAAAVAVLVGELLMTAAFLLGQAILAARGAPSAGLGDPGVLSAVLGGGLYLAAIGLLAAGLGTILRSTAAALATLVGVVFLVPALGPLFPSWLHDVLLYWPSLGGAAVFATLPDPELPHPWLNLGGMSLGVAAVLAAAFVLFRRRDV